LQIIFGAIGVITLVGVAGFFIAGTTLPSTQSFPNEVEINATPDEVWGVINDREKFTEWQDQIERVEIYDEKHWNEYLKNTGEPLKFTLASDNRPGKMEFHYTMGDEFAGHWTGEITETATGVKLRTVDSYAADGRLTKIMIYAFFDLDKFAKEWNGKLKARVESLN
jgi:hypothetical protein